MANPVEDWKAEKHGLDVWPDVERYAAAGTPMKDIDTPDLERMKWHGFFYRKRDEPGRYMNRIRITAGEMSAAQARAIAHIAYDFGHGIVDITTRANVQVQGLPISSLPKIAQRLSDVGLTSKQTGHDNIRNVFAHPFSGLLEEELYDTRQLCHEITELFVDSREYSDLPRKFNICLNGSDQHSAHFWTQDLSFLATREQGQVMFQVLVGGTQGQNPHLAWHLPVIVAPDQVVPVTRAMLDLFRAKGSRDKRSNARFRYLMEEIGVGGVLEWLEQELPFPLQPYVREPVCASSNDDFIGWFRQSDPNQWIMGLSVPLGRLTWQQLEGLALLAKRWGNGQLRTTHEQGIAVIGIPPGFRDAAATAAAALGLSVHASPLERNTIACTGSQFCNIAVTETKGHMFQLIEALRAKALMLHGIRIHMSGCPSSCAQHFTADIGLKGVRVRRLLGTREGFDVYLGGGLAGKVHMGLPYKLGVDVDQLPTLVEEVVREYYLRHNPGQTFSAYWREVLQAREADKVGDADYQLPVWVCECCNHHHTGEDPPVFCPRCAGLRRNFARIEDEDPAESQSSTATEDPPARTDGFVYAADDSALSDSEGLTVTLNGRDYALFRAAGQVHAIDSECPHEGAPLAQGEFSNGVVTCPWHNWTFNVCSGCSLEPAGNDVKHYETLVENGKIWIKVGEALATSSSNGRNGKLSAADIARAARTPVSNDSNGSPIPLATPKTVILPVLEVIDETPDVRTFRLDNRQQAMPLDVPGRFAKVCATLNGHEVWRSFTICSSPTCRETIDLTIKLNPDGELSRHLFETVQPGSELKLKGPFGGFFLDPQKHPEPLVLISAGSGITPMMSIVRFLQAHEDRRPCRFLFGARTAADIIFHDECQRLTAEWPEFRYYVTLSRPDDAWQGPTGRLNFKRIAAEVPDLGASRYYICGPNDFMETLVAELAQAGVAKDRLHTEQFHAQKPAGV